MGVIRSARRRTVLLTVGAVATASAILYGSDILLGLLIQVNEQTTRDLVWFPLVFAAILGVTWRNVVVRTPPADVAVYSLQNASGEMLINAVLAAVGCVGVGLSCVMLSLRPYGVYQSPAFDSPLALTTFALSMPIIFGATEEIAFRGVLQGYMSRVMPPTVALVIANVLFLLYHIGTATFIGMLPLILVVGLTCGVLAKLSPQIRYPVVVHCTTNALLAMYSLLGMSSAGRDRHITGAVLCLSAATVALWIFARRARLVTARK